MNKELFKAEIEHKAKVAVARIKKGMQELIEIDEIETKEVQLLEIVIERQEEKLNVGKPSQLQESIGGPLKDAISMSRESVPSQY